MSKRVIAFAAMVVVTALITSGCAVGDSPALPAQPSVDATSITAPVSPTPAAANPSPTEPSPPATATVETTGTPEPDPSAAEKPSKDAQSAVTALAAAKELPVKGRAPKTGYERALFGSGWVDIDRNGCDTRNDILARDLAKAETSGNCKVTAGAMANEPYTGKQVTFKPGSGTNLQIDHVVALSDAWQKGAQQWEWSKRVAFANDPLNLLAVDSSANMSKGDGDTATWLPKNKSYRCEYVARQVAVKTKYGAWVTEAEQDAMVRVLETCPHQALPSFGTQSVNASNTGGAEPEASAKSKGKAESKPKAKKKSSGGRDDPRFGSCKEARSKGYGPYVEGKDPEYDWYRDGDKDGTVCE